MNVMNHTQSADNFCFFLTGSSGSPSFALGFGAGFLGFGFGFGASSSTDIAASLPSSSFFGFGAGFFFGLSPLTGDLLFFAEAFAALG